MKIRFLHHVSGIDFYQIYQPDGSRIWLDNATQYSQYIETDLHAMWHILILRAPEQLSNSYTIGWLPVHEDNPQALVSG